MISPRLWPVTVTAPGSSSGASSASRAGSPPAAWKSCIRPVPEGWTSASTGTPAPRRPKSSRGSGTPARPAIAARWMTALVEPPAACSTRIALPNAAGDSTTEGDRSLPTAATAHRPACSAAAMAAGSPAGIVLDPGIISPSASAISAIVDAVPMVLHAPGPQARHLSRSRQPVSSSRPARRSSHSRHSAVPEPIRCPRKAAGSRAPPVTTTVGMSALAAPMIAPGTDLSQLARMTIPSSG